MTKLSNWLEKNLSKSIKHDLESTLETLIELKPPLKGDSSKQKKSFKIVYLFSIQKKTTNAAYKSLYAWINKSNELKIIDQRNRAVFRRALFFSNIMQHAIGSLTDLALKKELQKAEELQEVEDQEAKNEDKKDDYDVEKDDQKEKDQGVQESDKEGQDNLIFHVLSSQIPQRFSFPPSEQGAYVKSVLEHVKKSLFRFIVKHEQYIPRKTVENFVSRCSPPKQTDFSDADLLCILNFMIQNISLFTLGQYQTLFCGPYRIDPSLLFKSFKVEARHHNAHEVTHLEGRWSDEKLQRLLTLALEVIICLGDHEAFEPLVEIKRKLDTELAERLTLARKRKCEEEEECNVKRKYLSNIEYGEFTDFVLYLVSKLEKNEDQTGQIVRMAVAKNDKLIDIWDSLITRKDENAKIKKFVALINFQFDMHLKIKDEA
ncbi:hypothetical protein C2G38_2191542 [Gigaspora rosea]|uniref:Uncharacterized protein n=1 Tax=Gigaspora rosea TaxID=44941 RepID=A0A397UZZ7_9GLOM|nr:hypothetical protein C2G38_2191542 [Gigaspora rosea]